MVPDKPPPFRRRIAAWLPARACNRTGHLFGFFRRRWSNPELFGNNDDYTTKFLLVITSSFLPVISSRETKEQLMSLDEDYMGGQNILTRSLRAYVHGRLKSKSIIYTDLSNSKRFQYIY